MGVLIGVNTREHPVIEPKRTSSVTALIMIVPVRACAGRTGLEVMY